MAVQVINGPGVLNGPAQLQTVAPPGYGRAFVQTTVQVVRQGVLRPAPFAQWTPLYPGTDSQFLEPLYGDPFGDTPLSFPQRADDRGVIQIWAPEPVAVELQVFVYGYASVRQLVQLQFTEDPGDTALDALATHIADANDPHAAAGYITQTEADDQFLTADEADALFLTQAEGDLRYSMVNVSGITKTQGDAYYVNVEGDRMLGNLGIGTPATPPSVTWSPNFLGTQVGVGGALVGNVTTPDVKFSSNLIYDGSYKTAVAGPMTSFEQRNGDFTWYAAPSAAAGAAVSPLARMTLNNKGVLTLWTTDPQTTALILRGDDGGVGYRIMFKRGDFGPAWTLGYGTGDEWQLRSENTLRASVSRSGTVTISPDSGQPALGFVGAATSTSAAAGGAAALPVTPAGYLNVVVDGLTRRIPYYA